MASNNPKPVHHSFFNPKSAGTRFLTGLANLIIVNLLFIITCIPVITIGASVTSLYRITIAILAGDNPSVWRDYLTCFKNNFVKATLFQLLYMALTAFFLFEIFMVNNMMDPQYYWAAYPAYFFIAMIFSSSIYTFPLLAWFEESFKQYLKNSILIAVSNIPVTLMIIVITGGLAFLVYQFTVTSLSILIFMGFSTIALFYSLFFKRIFEKLGAKISFEETEGRD